MNSLPGRLLARGTAIRSTTRQVAGSFSIALLSAFLVAQTGVIGPPATPEAAQADQAAFNAVFAVCAIACLAIAIGLVPRGEEMRRNTKARAADDEELVGDS